MILNSSWRLILLFGVLALCLWFEYLRPLRRVTQSKGRRVLLNLSIAAVGAVAVRLAVLPVILAVSWFVVKHRWGLLQWVEGPAWAEIPIAILLLDQTLYVWHWMNHKIGFLWRFHNAHHVDLDLDTSTALRFHFGELILSAGFRSAQIVAFGIDPLTLALFETLITTAAQFHHSNVRLPLRWERVLNKVFVTPRMHGIHHSIVQEETNSNYSTLFSFWDRLHRSVRLHIPQSGVVIGVAPYRDPKELTLGKILWLPFTPQRPWRLPDGGVPRREPLPGVPKGVLADERN